jgi:putative transposase
LRQVDVLVSQGQNMVDAIRQIGVSEVTYYRWRQEFGGLKTEQVKRLKDLELENSRLRKAVSDLTLDKLILQGPERPQRKPERPPAQATCAARRDTLGLRDRIAKAGDGHTSWHRTRAVGEGGPAAPDLSGRIGGKAGSAARGPQDDRKARTGDGGHKTANSANNAIGHE